MSTFPKLCIFLTLPLSYLISYFYLSSDFSDTSSNARRVTMRVNSLVSDTDLLDEAVPEEDEEDADEERILHHKDDINTDVATDVLNTSYDSDIPINNNIDTYDVYSMRKSGSDIKITINDGFENSTDLTSDSPTPVFKDYLPLTMNGGLTPSQCDIEAGRVYVT